MDNKQHLAWHETLEIHELVAFQSIGLMKLKKSIKDIQDNNLRTIYENSIKQLEQHIGELLQFYSTAPREKDQDEEFRQVSTDFFAGDLLAFCKTAVRNYAIAITETATPVLRRTLNNHLQNAIKSHEQIFNYMYQKGLYPSYDLGELLKSDQKLANKALNM
ncbi:spore coat protein [Oceanobacillus halotolerans]|uniref:spore coat protein n=1 Tax=Oceanobacillus halotolerans TaxID=2663380 RepID=UPI0013DA3FD0|nr:spore coat protein [Oceanobacillus halotolerans]